MARKKAGKKASAAAASRKTSSSVKELIASVRNEQAAIAAEAEKRSRERLQAVIDAKKAEHAAAQAKANEAQKAADAIASDLDKLLAAAGMVRRGRKGKKGASGRKPRVTMDRKLAEVEAALKKIGKGIDFSKLRASLLSITDAELGGPVFAGTDFNSAKVFGKKMLPSGWHVVGERKTARIERK